MGNPSILRHGLLHSDVLPLCFFKQNGSMYLGACPLTQLECQKLVLSPLPTVTIVEAVKRSLSVLS
jgi:hypothetical protein